MEAVLCDISALAYWRSRSEAIGSPDAPVTSVPSRRGLPRVDAPTRSLLDDLFTWGVIDGDETHLLVTSRNRQRRLQGAHVHLLSVPVPAGSFVRTLGQVYVVCPELLFVMMAARLDLVSLLELGHELCGAYRLSGDGTAAYDLKPLTSVSALCAFSRRCKGLRGARRALQATQWIADGSRSPAETALSIAFRLPYRHGGYSLGCPLLNHQIALNGPASLILGRDSISPDLYWPDARHPCEYESRQFHSSREQADYDERRRNAYAAMGMSVTVIRPRHLLDLSVLDAMVASIRRNARRRLNDVPADYDERRRVMFDRVFRRWHDLREASLDEEEFGLRARQLDAPDSPW